MDPVLCVYDSQSKEIVAQVFNFIDVLGGKQQINPDSLERFLAVRGIIQPKQSDVELLQQGKKEAETYNFYTKMAVCAGEAYALNDQELAEANEKVEEMDRVEVIELDQATFKYEKGLVDVFRAVEDPFGNEFKTLGF